MMIRILLFFGALLVLCPVMKAQEAPIRIVEEETNNRLMLYAYNESDTDYDVKLTVKGTNIRQSRAQPRFVRVPAASRVFMKTLIPMRGKKASYTYTLDVNDSLSNRALQREYEKIKIKPRKQIVLYVPSKCYSCDSLLNDMSEGNYLYTSFILKDHPEIQQQLQQAFANTSPVDSLEMPIVNLGGRLHTDLENYGQILEAMVEE